MTAAGDSGLAVAGQGLDAVESHYERDRIDARIILTPTHGARYGRHPAGEMSDWDYLSHPQRGEYSLSKVVVTLPFRPLYDCPFVRILNGL